MSRNTIKEIEDINNKNQNSPCSWGSPKEPEAVQVQFKILAKRFELKYISLPKPQKILRLLSEGECQSEIAKKTCYPKSTVNYWTKKFLSDNLIRVTCEGTPMLFELTAFGSKVLTSIQRGFRESCVMEDFPMKFRLVSDRDDIDWEKLGEPRNWEKMGFMVCGVRVEKNLGRIPSIIIHTGQLMGFHPDELLVEAGIIVQAVKARLYDLGVVTDEVGFPIRKATFKTYSSEAEVLNRNGTVQTKDGWIDHSKPSSIPHEERWYEQQKDYLAMPRRIRELGPLIGELLEGQKDLQREISDLVKALKNQVH